MDPKSKMNFINKIVNEEVFSCPKCGASNKAGNKVCISCGNALSELQNNTAEGPAFEKVVESVSDTENKKYVEANYAFAQGLPDWSIEPPQIIVRRK